MKAMADRMQSESQFRWKSLPGVIDLSFDNFPEYLLVVDSVGKVDAVNRKFREDFPFLLVQNSTANLLDWVDTAFRFSLEGALASVGRDQDCERLELMLKMRLKGDHLCDVRLTVSNLDVEHGRGEHLVQFAPVSQARRVPIHSDTLLDGLRRLVAATHQPMAVFHPNGEMLTNNSAFTQVFHLREHGVPPGTSYNMMEDSAFLSTHLRDLLRRGLAGHPIQAPLSLPNTTSTGEDVVSCCYMLTMYSVENLLEGERLVVVQASQISEEILADRKLAS